MYCHKCGTKNPDKSTFCNKCGGKLVNEDMKGFDTHTTHSPTNSFKQPFTKMGIAAIPLGALSLGYAFYGFNNHGSLEVGILFGVLGTIFSSIGLYAVLKRQKRNKIVAVSAFVLSLLGLIMSISCYNALPNNKAKESTPTNNTSINIFNQENKNESPSEIPDDYKNAQIKAQAYSDGLHMSRQGIYDKLTSASGDNFSSAAADYALDNIKADYNKNALIKAQGYSASGMTKDAIYDRLCSAGGDKFTIFEAQYAIDNLK